MRRESAAHLWDAAEAAQLICEFTRRKTLMTFGSDVLVRSAVERQLEILGEALNRLRRGDPDTSMRVPDLDKIVGMRNIIAHEYGTIDYEIVWSAVTTSIPPLIPILRELVDEAERTVDR